MSLSKYLSDAALGASQITELLKLTKDMTVKILKDDTTKAVIQKVLDVLNNKDISVDIKTNALEVLANLAMKQKVRDLILDLLKGGLTEVIDDTLKELKKSSRIGKFHQLIVMILCRSCDYKFTASDLLELLDKDIDVAFLLVEAILKTTDCEDMLLNNMLKIFYGLTRPDTYFKKPDDTFQLLASLLMYQDLMGKMCDKLFTNNSFLVSCCDTIFERFFKKPRKTDLELNQHLLIIYLLQGIYDLYMINSSSTTNIREYLIKKTGITGKVLIPYIINSVEFAPALSKAATFVEDPILVQGIIVALKLLCTISFRVEGDDRNQLLLSNFTVPLLQSSKFFQAHQGILSLLLLYNANIDSFHPSYDLEIPDDVMPHNILGGFGDIFSELNIEDVIQVTNLLEKSGEINVSRDTVTYALLFRLLDSYLEDPSCDESMSPPPTTDDLDDTFNDTTGSIEPNTPIKQHTKEESKSQSSSPVKATPKPDKVKSLLGDLPPIGPGQCTLQLPPDLDKTMTKKRHKKRSKKQQPPLIKPAPKPTDVPEEFVCAINGHVMRKPMKSPYGQVFEKDTIEKWLKENGNTCPITGKSLKIGDLKYDEELSKRITQWQIEKVMNMNVLKVDNEDELYDF